MDRSGSGKTMLLVGAAAVGLVLFAVAGPREAEAADAAISDGVVKIGVLGDYGSGRDLGGPGSVTAAKLAAEDTG